MGLLNLNIGLTQWNVTAVLLMFSLVTAFASPKPMLRQLDEVDACLFTCDYCYKNDGLVKCANECLSTSGVMSAGWHYTCPQFGQSIYLKK